MLSHKWSFCTFLGVTHRWASEFSFNHEEAGGTAEYAKYAEREALRKKTASCWRLCVHGFPSSCSSAYSAFSAVRIAVLTELGRATGVVVTITMTLLAELAHFPALEMVMSSREHQRTRTHEARQEGACVVECGAGFRGSAALGGKDGWREPKVCAIRGGWDDRIRAGGDHWVCPFP